MAYVYRHIRLDKNQPFYIGIGSDCDFEYKRAYSKHNRGRLWRRIANKTEFEVDILFDEIELSFAKAKEIEFIELYKRINDGGILANVSAGGDGFFDPPKEFRQALAKRNIGNKYNFGKRHSEEAKKKITAALKARTTNVWVGRKHTDESRLRISESQKGKKLSDEHKAKISAFFKGKKYNLGKKHSEEVKAKLSEQRKGDKNANFKGFITAFKNDVPIGEFYGIKECSEKLKMDIGSISSCLTGKKKIAKGFTFKRINQSRVL